MISSLEDDMVNGAATMSAYFSSVLPDFKSSCVENNLLFVFLDGFSESSLARVEAETNLSLLHLADHARPFPGIFILIPVPSVWNLKESSNLW